MGLLDGIEKLINEHGSAVIQEKQIALLKEEYAALERKTREFDMENNNLKAQLDQARKEINRLNNLVETCKNQSVTKLGDDSEQILKYIFDVAREVSTEEVATHFGLSLSKVSYDFDLFLEKDFILPHRSAEYVSDLVAVRGGSHTERPATFIIAPQGRRYVVEVIGI